jgi:hypothetical protein
LPACTGLSWWWSSSSPSFSSLSTGQEFKNNFTNPSLVSTTTSKSNARGSHCWHNLSFIHIHKCGGTTIQATMRALRTQIMTMQQSYSSSSYVSITSNVDTYQYSSGGGSQRQKEVNRQKRLAYIQAIARAQQQQDHLDTLTTGLTSSSSSSEPSLSFPVFTIVRDPVDRFLSAFQQIMHYHDDFRSACLKSTAKATIQCVIQYVRQRASISSADVHLAPMAVHLRLFHETDVAISVFHLKDINAISQYLTLDEGSTSLSSFFPFSSVMMTSHGNTTTSAKTKTTIAPVHTIKHIHDRRQVKFATSQVLATMSVKDCDDQMLQDICHLYAVDVAMMHSLGFETPYCSTTNFASS